MSGSADHQAWAVPRPWRRFRRELAAGAGWFAAVGALGLWAGMEPWAFVLLAAAAAYVLGPFVLPMRVRLEGEGVRRGTPLGERFFPWSRFGGFTQGSRGRVAFLHRSGGGLGRLAGSVTLFLPEDEAQQAAALARLAEALPRGTAKRESSG